MAGRRRLSVASRRPVLIGASQAAAGRAGVAHWSCADHYPGAARLGASGGRRRICRCPGRPRERPGRGRPGDGGGAVSGGPRIRRPPQRRHDGVRGIKPYQDHRCRHWRPGHPRGPAHRSRATAEVGLRRSRSCQGHREGSRGRRHEAAGIARASQERAGDRIGTEPPRVSSSKGKWPMLLCVIILEDTARRPELPAESARVWTGDLLAPRTAISASSGVGITTSWTAPGIDVQPPARGARFCVARLPQRRGQCCGKQASTACSPRATLADRSVPDRFPRSSPGTCTGRPGTPSPRPSPGTSRSPG